MRVAIPEVDTPCQDINTLMPTHYEMVICHLRVNGPQQGGNLRMHAALSTEGHVRDATADQQNRRYIFGACKIADTRVEEHECSFNISILEYSFASIITL